MYGLTSKNCPGCGEDKPLDEFYTDINRPSGVSSRCRDCANAARRARYHAQIERERQRSRSYYAANKARVRARYRQARKRAVAIYGGCCERCGSAAGLEFHHVAGNGGVHRREIEDHQALYRRISRAGRRLVRPRLALLCRGCHRAGHRPAAARVSTRNSRPLQVRW